MRFDASQRHWALASAIILVLSAAVYHVYVYNSAFGARGGSPAGLAFGVLGFAFMLFAALLGARKRVPVWRIGRAQAWMRGHLWLGLLSLPIILFHGGFHFGGTLTRVLMWLLIITVVSGLFGAALQHYIPRVMTADVPFETVYDEIGNVRNLLLEEADRSMEALCGSLGFRKSSQEEIQRAGGFTAMRPMAAATEALPSPPRRKFCCSPKKKALRFAASTSTKCARSSSGLLNADFCSPTQAKPKWAFPGYARCCPRAPTPPSTICRTSVKKRASSRSSSACTTGCTSGCLFTFRFRWR